MVKMKSPVFCDMPLCSPVKVNRYFGGTYHLHLYGRRISQKISQHEADSEESIASRLLHASSLLSLQFDPKVGGDTFPWKRRFIFTGLHGVISQKLQLLMFRYN
jgi:hypothetical protein